MKDDRRTVHEVMVLTGITARTLHYYDEIGLLTPSSLTASGYRLYSNEDLCRLQEILFLREVGFPLKEIKALLNSPAYNRQAALKKQLEILEAKKARTEQLILLIHEELTGRKHPSFDAFSHSSIDDLQDQYRTEVLKKWKDTAAFQIYESNRSRQSSDRQSSETEAFQSFAKDLLTRFSLSPYQHPENPLVQALVQEWQDYISSHFYPCNKKMLSQLGSLYLEDQRFSAFFNQAAGTEITSYFCKAIAWYCQKSE